MSYPPKETELDTIASAQHHHQHQPHHKPAKVELSTELPSKALNQAFARNIASPMNLPLYSHEFGSSMNGDILNRICASPIGRIDSGIAVDRIANRYYSISKHEHLPSSHTPASLVSDSVSPRSTSTTLPTDLHHSNSFYQHHSLELPSPSSSTSSQTSKTNLSLFGSYSPSPFPLLPNLPFDSPNIFPPTPPPSTWNPFW